MHTGQSWLARKCQNWDYEKKAVYKDAAFPMWSQLKCHLFCTSPVDPTGLWFGCLNTGRQSAVWNSLKYVRILKQPCQIWHGPGRFAFLLDKQLKALWDTLRYLRWSIYIHIYATVLSPESERIGGTQTSLLTFQNFENFETLKNKCLWSRCLKRKTQILTK